MEPLRGEELAVALTDFGKCAELRPGDHTTEIYLERCRALLGSMPADWSPALEMTDK